MIYINRRNKKGETVQKYTDLKHSLPAIATRTTKNQEKTATIENDHVSTKRIEKPDENGRRRKREETSEEKKTQAPRRPEKM